MTRSGDPAVSRRVEWTSRSVDWLRAVGKTHVFVMPSARPRPTIGTMDVYRQAWKTGTAAAALLGITTSFVLIAMAEPRFTTAVLVLTVSAAHVQVRLRANGVQLVYSPDAVAYQHYEKDFAALARDTREKGRTAVQLARKHPSSAADLKLSQFDRGPLVGRLARNALLAASNWWPRTPDIVVRTMSWLGNRRAPALHRVYPVALDYLYWLGVRSARAGDDAVTERGPTTAPVP